MGSTFVVGGDGLCSGLSVARLAGDGEGYVLAGFEAVDLEQYADVLAVVGVTNEVLYRDVVWSNGQFGIDWCFRFLRFFAVVAFSQ